MEDKVGCLYLLTSPSGKRYIGITSSSFEHRWAQHVCGANVGSDYPISRAIRKYGPESFQRRVLAIARMSDLRPLEERAIVAYGSRRPSGYNLRSGGEQKNHHPETIEKTRAALKGRQLRGIGWKHSEETRRKMSASHRGMRHSEESRAKMSATRKRIGQKPPSRKGSTFSEEWKTNQSARMRKWWASRKAGQ